MIYFETKEETERKKSMETTVLLVEDNESIIKGLEFSLKENGYEVTVRKDVNSTIVFLEHNKVDFIILDVLLPDGNGFSLYQNQIQNKNIPNILNNIFFCFLLNRNFFISSFCSTKDLYSFII